MNREPEKEEATETGGKQVLRDKGGRFVPGASGNPSGSPRGRRAALVEIEEAIEEYQQTEGVSYWHAATILAMELAKKGNTALLGKIMDKFLPSKLDAEVSTRPYVMMPSITKSLPDGTMKEMEFNIGSDPKAFLETQS